MSMASWTYCPEAYEEEKRVTQVKRFRLPERWFVPRPEEQFHTWRGKVRTRALRRSQCFALPGRKPALSNLDSRGPESEPDYEPRPTDLVGTIAELLTLAPYYLQNIYTEARALQEEDGTEAQLILAALLEAMPRLDPPTRTLVRREVQQLDPKDRFVKHLRAVLA